MGYGVIKSLINNQFDGIILQDYDKGFLSNYMMERVVDFGNRNNIPVFVDPKNKLVNGATIFKPNKKELLNFSQGKSIEDSFAPLYDKIKPKYLVATAGDEGMYIYDGKELKNVPTIARDVIDVMGAGDTVIASLALAYVSGGDIYYSCDIKEAESIVTELTEKKTPLIWEISDVQRILNPKIQCRDAILVFLHKKHPHPVSIDDLLKWTSYANKTNFIKIIKILNEKILIEYDKVNNRVFISPTGIKKAEEIIRTFTQ